MNVNVSAACFEMLSKMHFPVRKEKWLLDLEMHTLSFAD